MFFVPGEGLMGCLGLGKVQDEKLDPQDGYCWMDRILPKARLGRRL